MEPNDPTLERSSPFSGSDEYCVLVLYISSTIEGKEVDVEVDELQDCIKKYAKAKKVSHTLLTLIDPNPEEEERRGVEGLCGVRQRH